MKSHFEIESLFLAVQIEQLTKPAHLKFFDINRQDNPNANTTALNQGGGLRKDLRPNCPCGKTRKWRMHSS